MAPTKRRTVARPAGAVSLGESLLATPAAVGGAGRVAESLADLCGPAGRARPTRWGRNVRRWPLGPGETRGGGVGKTTRGKGTKWMVVVDGHGVPRGNLLDSASPAEVTLLEPTLEMMAVPRPGPGRPRKNPQRVIYDKAGDSDPLRRRLARRGIELMCPHRRNRAKPPWQDGRKLRRYRRRWKVDRTFAWLGNFRRLVVRWEHHILMYRAFFHVACLLITLRQL
jgi:transposase